MCIRTRNDQTQYRSLFHRAVQQTTSPLQKHLCRCLLASWNLDQNLGVTYEYVLEIADRPSRLGFPEGTLTSVCVYEQETIKLNTDHYFIEQYHRQRAPLKHLCRCVLLRPINWNLDQNLGRICNRRRYCS